MRLQQTWPLGPAFGRGGTQPTVTDAHVTLGNIRADRMGEGVRLDAPAAHRAVDALAARLGVEPARCAHAMIATADAEMARALRRMSVERSIDPRECVLVAFGGGGPLHACGLAERLGMTRILVPPFAGVLSALGLAVAPGKRVGMASVMAIADDALDGPLREAAASAARKAGGEGADAWIARARYRGQGHELEVPHDPTHPVSALRAAFREMHHRRYGFGLEAPVEVVSVRCTRTAAAPAIVLRRHGPNTWNDGTSRDDGGALDATVMGRAVVALPDATMLIAEGWTARALEIGGWLLER